MLEPQISDQPTEISSGLVSPRGRSGSCGREEHLYPCPGIECRIVDVPASNSEVVPVLN
jgi:hypothetical protein